MIFSPCLMMVVFSILFCPLPFTSIDCSGNWKLLYPQILSHFSANSPVFPQAISSQHWTSAVLYIYIYFLGACFICIAGALCNCLLPEALKTTTVRQPEYENCDGEKQRLRTTFSCLSSISMRQKQLSASSLILHSPLKGCLPPWATFPLKDR